MDKAEEVLLNVKSPRLYFTGGLEVEISGQLSVFKGATVLVGPNASGKTVFARILEKGRNFRTNNISFNADHYPVVKYIEFNDIHNFAGITESYYQQRYESGMNDETPSISELIGSKCRSAEFLELLKEFNLQGIENKKINFLSSGELRKFLIINALTENPDLLIIDNPYIGLDRPSREILNKALGELKNKGRSFMLIVADKEEAPQFTDRFIYANGMAVSSNERTAEDENYSPFDFSGNSESHDIETVCEMKDCTVNYGKSVILQKLNWKILKGERWSLSGPNGSGKSTLLSLLNADNPKSYSNNLYLWGRKRGTGESIWDIKRHIGYVSPEMMLHFRGMATVLQIVANGLNDTMGLYVKPTEDQIEKAKKWLEHFNISHLSDRLYSTLSAGERQLVMVARSFIKEPLLLILDEPMHALDRKNRMMVQKTLEDFLNCHPDSTLIMVTHNPEELPSSINRHLKLKSRFEH